MASAIPDKNTHQRNPFEPQIVLGLLQLTSERAQDDDYRSALQQLCDAVVLGGLTSGDGRRDCFRPLRMAVNADPISRIEVSACG